MSKVVLIGILAILLGGCTLTTTTRQVIRVDCADAWVLGGTIGDHQGYLTGKGQGKQDIVLEEEYPAFQVNVVRSLSTGSPITLQVIIETMTYFQGNGSVLSDEVVKEDSTTGNLLHVEYSK